jgi:hypothetical protein
MESGDLVFFHTTGLMGASIRFGQRKVKAFKGTAKWNHVGILDEKFGDDWSVIQAEPRGVTKDKLLSQVALGGSYEVVPLPAGLDRVKFINYLRVQVSDRYSFLTIFSCVADILLPDAICLRRNFSWICSGLAAAALMFAGFPAAADWGDVYTVMPAELREML